MLQTPGTHCIIGIAVNSEGLEVREGEMLKREWRSRGKVPIVELFTPVLITVDLY